MRDGAVDYGCHPGGVQWVTRAAAGQPGHLYTDRHSVIDRHDADTSNGNMRRKGVTGCELRVAGYGLKVQRSKLKGER